MADNVNPSEQFERLFKVLGFDPSKDVGPKTGEAAAANVFASAMKEVVAKRAAANQAKAVVLVEQLIAQKEKWDEEERKFMGSRKKFFKDFGKALNKIEALARGETVTSAELQ